MAAGGTWYANSRLLWCVMMMTVPNGRGLSIQSIWYACTSCVAQPAHQFMVVPLHKNREAHVYSYPSQCSLIYLHCNVLCAVLLLSRHILTTLSFLYLTTSTTWPEITQQHAPINKWTPIGRKWTPIGWKWTREAFNAAVNSPKLLLWTTRWGRWDSAHGPTQSYQGRFDGSYEGRGWSI